MTRRASRGSGQAETSSFGEPLPALILISALSFNALLAVINAHVAPLTPAFVIACEVAIVTAAHAIALANYRREMAVWYVLAGILVLIALYRALATQQFEAKLLRDVLLVPTFTVLGMCFEARHLTRLVLIVHAIVVGFLFFEAVDSSSYAKLFSIQEYYVSTRGLRLQDFWDKNSDLFVSATRPDARYFSFLSLHRLSSIFLEPVSLGNYCVAITCYLCARWNSLSRGAKWFLVVGNLAAIFGCDGRFAAFSSIVIVAVALVAPMLPRYTAILYLPGTVVAVIMMVSIGGLHSGTDDFAGRIAFTSELLGRYDFWDMMGVSDAYLSAAVDSGVAYLIATQSIIGVCIIWIFVVYATRAETDDQIRYSQVLCLYISFSLMVSFALFTIKTAALLWFINGSLQARSIERRPSQRRTVVQRTSASSLAVDRCDSEH
jgi:putative polymerase